MPDELHDAGNSVQCPEFLPRNRECIQERESGRFRPLLDRQITSKFTRESQLAVPHREDTGQK
jgi:hypothetical protein